MTYQAYESQILEYLIDAGGRALRKDIERELGIPKASMTNVMDRLLSRGFIKVLPTFRNRTYWEITFDGKLFYQFGEGPLPEYKLTSTVERYLIKKPCFKGDFLPVQETFIRRGMLTSTRNVAVFGPPASGKTLIAEMCMIREVERGGKVLYATPYKALDRQKFKEFQTFNDFGFPVRITDGDHPSSQDALRKAPVVIATYERALGAISAGEEWLQDISLLCADEITLLGENRGPTIDTLLTIFMTDSPARSRIITLSSHVGNKLQIADWLQAEAVIEDIYHDIEEFIAYKEKGHIVLWSKNGKKQRIESADSIIEYLIRQNVEKGETTLVFVNTRWEAHAIAEALKTLHQPVKSRENLSREIKKRLNRLEEETPLVRTLCKLLESGVAFHHAGLPMAMRELVEDLLEARRINTVVCTTTLSHGIDYPVDNVIVFLSGLKKRWELDAYVCVQLEGRAGRPGKSYADNIPGRGRAFLVTDKEDAVHCMEKYVFGKPEAIHPDTLAEENLARFILVDLGLPPNNTKTISDVAYTVSKMLAVIEGGADLKQIHRAVTEMVNELEGQGLLRLEEDRLTITEMGSFMNTTNISPYDASLVLQALEKGETWQVTITPPRRMIVRKGEGKEFTGFGVLHLACCIDVAKKVREVGLLSSLRILNKTTHSTVVDPHTVNRDRFVYGFLKALVLTDWNDEISLSEICSKYSGYDDQDVFQLGMYASRSLTKIGQVANRLKLRELARLAEDLSVRTKYGVREDLAKSGMVFLHGIGRVRGRRLLEHGFNVERIASSRPRDLKSVLGDTDLCRSVVRQSRRRIKDESS